MKSMGKMKMVCCFIIFLEVVAASCLLANVIIQDKKVITIETSLSDWKSDYIEYENGWYVEETDLKTEDTEETKDTEETDDIVTIISGPHMKLGRGSYQVDVSYACDQNQYFWVGTDSTSRLRLRSHRVVLSKNKTSISWKFSLLEDVDDFWMDFVYSGNGGFSIKDVKMQTDSAASSRMFTVFLLLSIMVDVCFCLRKKIFKERKLLLSLAVVSMFISLPLFIVWGMGNGHDLTFHLMRIEGIAHDLRNGNIPSKIPSLWLDGYGYPVSVYYGDLLLYVPAILRIAGFSMVTSYKTYVFLINTGTVVISYICFQKIFVKRETALLLSMAYVTALYRIVDVYVRAAVGEYSAMMFFPLIALAVYRIYTQDAGEWKLYRKNSLLLALGMTGVIGTHILSTEMTVFILALLCIVLWKKTFRKNTLKAYGLAVLQTVVLNLYFLIPFLDYYVNIKVKVNAEDSPSIQSIGAYIRQYFEFHINIFDGSVGFGHFAMTPGIVLMAALLLSFRLWGSKKASGQMKILTLFSVVSLFLASNLFPWGYLTKHFMFGKMLGKVQFPWRYIGIAILFLTLLLGNVLQSVADTEKKGAVRYMIIAGCVLAVCFSVSDYKQAAISRGTCYYSDTVELDTCEAVSGGEYLREGTQYWTFTNEISAENMLEASMVSRNGTNMELYCKVSDMGVGSVELPILNYKGYRVSDEYGNTYPIEDGTNNVVRFSLPEGFSGNITVDFVEPWYWRIGEAVSLAAVMFFFFRFLF